jgi:hypothetical protein
MVANAHFAMMRPLRAAAAGGDGSGGRVGADTERRQAANYTYPLLLPVAAHASALLHVLYCSCCWR